MIIILHVFLENTPNAQLQFVFTEWKEQLVFLPLTAFSLWMKQGALESAGLVSWQDAFATSVSSSTLHGCIAKHSIWKKKALTFTTGPSMSFAFVALAFPVLRRTSETLLNVQCQRFLIVQLSKCQYFTDCLKIMVVWFISIIFF